MRRQESPPRGGGAFNELHDPLVEEYRIKTAEPLGCDLDAVGPFQLRKVVGKHLLLGAELLRVGVADIHGEHSPGRNDIDGVWLERDAAGGGDGTAVRQLTAAAQEGDDLRGGEARVHAVGGRRGAGMVLLSFDGDALPGNALQVFDRADGNALGVKNRSLLNVQLHEGAGLEKARLDRTRVPDASELLAEYRTVRADRGKRLFERVATRVDERTHHVGRVAHTLFVGERADGDGTRGYQSPTP